MAHVCSKNLLLCATVILAFSYFSDSHKINPIVTTKWGKIKGLYQRIEGNKIAKFVGIPYAEPPVNELRFAKPRAITSKHEGVFDATRELTHCYAMPRYYGLKDMSLEGEDCLRLSIWTPANSLTGIDLKPVLIYIHGGGFLVDGHRMAMVQPDVLSAKGDMVVVTIKYRLGVFGCLFADREDVPGNVLLEDQALGIEWVKDNIKYFGGDPDRITLSGLSAGSISVALHYLNPNVNRLFHRVIMRSGAVKTTFEESVENAKKRFEVVAKKVSCWTEGHLEVTIECLRKADVRELINSYVDSGKSMNVNTTFPNCLVAKGPYSQTEADKRLLASDFPKNIDSLITVMEDEGSIMLESSMIDPKKDPEENVRNLTSVYASGITHGELEDLIKLYFGGVVSNRKYENIKAMLKLIGDRYYHCPSIWFAEKVMEKSNVHFAKYTQISQTFAKLEPRIVFDLTYGPKHAADMVYFFGVPLREELKHQMTQEDIDLTLHVLDIVIRFVRDGKVNWSPYFKTSNGQIMAPRYELRSDKRINSTQPDPIYSVCQFWKKILYRPD